MATWRMPGEPLVFVGQGRDHLAGFCPHGRRRFHRVFPGDALSLRAVLREALVFLRGLDFGQDACGQVEIVLAEAMNNVIEHAFATLSHGVIELSIVHAGGRLQIEIMDDGLPMPDETLPEGRVQDLDVAREALPEGGFGWFLIRELAEDLDYSRGGNRNRLSFVIRPARLTE